MKKIIILVTILLNFIQPLQAKSLNSCFQEAANKHAIPVEYLLAVSYTESRFKPKVKGHNKNGSKDYGLMQINSIWSKQAKHMGYSWKKITTNPCTNIMFGGQILKDNRKRMGSWSAAIGAYNAGFAKTPKAKKRRARYYNLVMSHKKAAVKKIKAM
ncbi:MAG: hypothetical protein CSA44_03195 [Gammaproteobacteria bacterium]|nr:MAG: hypothetical protein CSA44_03195 [Gammaproteobacteria bacterium]